MAAPEDGKGEAGSDVAARLIAVAVAVALGMSMLTAVGPTMGAGV